MDKLLDIAMSALAAIAAEADVDAFSLLSRYKIQETAKQALADIARQLTHGMDPAPQPLACPHCGHASPEACDDCGQTFCTACMKHYAYQEASK